MSDRPSLYSPRDLEGVLRRAGDLLGGGRRLEVAESFRDSPGVLRCAVTGSGDGPETVILKLSGGSGGPAEGWLREWVAGEWLGGESGLAPRCHGADPELGLLVLEDVGGAENLLDVLMEGGAGRARALLVTLARRLGALHAATAGRGGELAALRRRRGLPVRPAAEAQAEELRRHAGELAPVLRELGVPPEPGFAGELEAVAEAIGRPGPWGAFTHGDPCPDNCRIDGDDLRMIDFEDGGWRHAWTDGAVGRMLFPACWCVRGIPPEVVAEMDAAYTEARGDVPADDPERARLDACAWWFLVTLGRHLGEALAGDPVWGNATLRQRILARADAFAEAAVASGELGEIRRLARALGETLRERWPDTAGLEPFPAFAAPADGPGPEGGLDAFAGEYSGELGSLRVAVRHGQLFLYSRILGEDLPCIRKKEETFSFKYGTVRFLRDPAAAVTGLEVDALGTTLEMELTPSRKGNPP